MKTPTAARHSQWVISYACLAWFRDRDEYQNMVAGAFGCIWGWTHLICLWYGSLSTIYHPVGLSKSKSTDDSNYNWSDNCICISASSRPSKWKGRFSLTFLLNRDSIQAKFGRNLWNTLYKPKNDLNFVMFVSCFCLWMALFVLFEMASVLALFCDRGSRFSY